MDFSHIRGGESMKRKDIFNEVEAILEQYCKGCFLYKQNRKDKGRNFAHKFCISHAQWGRRLTNVGKNLIRLNRLDM